MATDWEPDFPRSTVERPVVAVVGTMDTKGEEFRHLCDLIGKFGCATLVIDSGVIGEARCIEPSVSRREVAQAAGQDLEVIRTLGRGPAVEVMADGVAAIVVRLHKEGMISAILSMGGAEGTVLGCAAMRALPVGFPKVMVSAIASGRRQFGDFTGLVDIWISNSVVDVAGFNSITDAVYRNAAASVAGMTRAAVEDVHASVPTRRPVVGVTMLGNTQRAFDLIRGRLEPRFEVVPFHANGTGGRRWSDSSPMG